MIQALTILFAGFALWMTVGLIRSLWHRLAAGAVLVDAGANPETKSTD